MRASPLGAAGGLLIAGLAVLVYANSLDSPFVFDDLRNIVGNPAIRVSPLSLSGLARAAFESPLPRPVAYASFALNHAAGGYEVGGYHAVNVALHVGCALLVWALAGVFLSRQPRRPRYGVASAALFAGCLFAVHPVQTQAVTYVVQRMTSLATLFYLLAFLLYLVGRRARPARRAALWAAALAAWILALGSKEIAITLPAAIFLYEWYFERDLGVGWLRRNAPLAVGGVLALALVATLVLHLASPSLERSLASYADHDFTPRERLLTQARVVVFYLSLLCLPLPSRLNLLHDFSPSRSLFEPVSTALSLMLLLVLVAGAVWLARRERLLSFCIAWFFLQLLLESTVLPLEMAYEHRLYLPIVGFALLFADLLFRAAPGRFAAALAAIVVVTLGCWTHARNETWRDLLTLWTDVVAKSPRSARPRINLGTLLVLAGRYPEAVRQLSEAVRLAPEDSNAHNNLGQALARSGRLGAAMARFQEAVRLDPANASARFNLALALEERGRPEDARPHFAEALRIDPGYASFATQAYERGTAHAANGRLEAAVADYALALRMRADFPEAYVARAAALQRLDRIDDAIADLREATRLRPDDEALRLELGRALRRREQAPESAER